MRISIFLEVDVLWLEVSEENVFLMQIFEKIDEIHNDEVNCLTQGKSGLLHEGVKSKIEIFSVDKVNVALVFEGSNKVDHEAVVEGLVELLVVG
jgi:hypothetical protein